MPPVVAGGRPPGQGTETGAQSWYCLHRVEQPTMVIPPGSAVPLLTQIYDCSASPTPCSPSSIRGAHLCTHVTLGLEYFHIDSLGVEQLEVVPTLPSTHSCSLLCFM